MVPPTQTEPPHPESLPNEQQTLGAEFLAKVPEQDRAIVEKYVKDWDSGVTTKFQELNDKLTPWNEFGDINNVRTAMQTMTAMQADPLAFYNNFRDVLQTLVDEGFMEPFDNNTGQPSVQPQQQQQSTLPEFEGVPQQFVEEFQSMKKALEDLGGKVTAQETAAQDAENMKQLDNLISEMHTKHGQFDDEYFLVQLASGKTPDQAIESWNSFKTRVGSLQKDPAPVFASGGSVTSTSQVDPNKLSAEDRVKYVTSLLEANK